MNRHEQALLKAQSTVEKNKKFVKRYAKKDNGIILCPNADG